jgi:hypothetical protein
VGAVSLPTTLCAKPLGFELLTRTPIVGRTILSTRRGNLAEHIVNPARPATGLPRRKWAWTPGTAQRSFAALTDVVFVQMLTAESIHEVYDKLVPRQHALGHKVALVDLGMWRIGLGDAMRARANLRSKPIVAGAIVALPTAPPGVPMSSPRNTLQWLFSVCRYCSASESINSRARALDNSSAGSVRLK